VTDFNHISLSAYVITFNNERTIETALQSLCWVDEFVIVDSFSTDRTVELSRKYTDKIVQRKWPGFRDQYQFAAEQCSHRWLLFIDADEEISPRLAEEMQAALAANVKVPEDRQVKGYHAPRRTYYLGRWHLHGGWVPDHEIRLYDRECGSWEGGLHANVHVRGPEAHLKGFYYHYTYANISEQLGTIDRYSTAAVEEIRAAGSKYSACRLIVNPLARFCRDYFLKGGFREGLPGLIVAVNTMFYVFTKYAKSWEAGKGYSPFGDREELP